MTDKQRQRREYIEANEVQAHGLYQRAMVYPRHPDAVLWIHDAELLQSLADWRRYGHRWVL
jgi:hypothetical protein